MQKKSLTDDPILEQMTAKEYFLSSVPLERYSWAILIQTGNFTEALAEIDSSLAANTHAQDVRLWWLYTQLELAELPITALTAALDEVRAQEASLPELRSLLTSVSLRIGLELVQRKQFRLAVALIEGVDSLCKKHALYVDNQERAVLGLLSDALAQEMDKAVARREQKKYLTTLDEKITSVKKRLDALPEKSKLSFYKSPTADPFIPQTTPVPDFIPQKKSGAAKNSLYFLVLIFVLLSLAWFSFNFLFSSSGGAAFKDGLAARVPLPNESQLEFPALGTQPNTFSDSTLSKVNERLKQGTGNAAQAASSPEAGQEVDLNALDPKHAPGLSAKPTPEDELESMSNIPEAKIDPNKVPLLDPNKMATTKVEEIGSDPRKASVPNTRGSTVRPGEIGKKGDGRVYGPLRTEDPVGGRNKGSALDGSPLKSYEVQRFDVPRTFQTITATEVLSAPSLLSPSLARLESGTPIHVTAKMGLWLELRSTGGRLGYIYAQDAREGQ